MPIPLATRACCLLAAVLLTGCIHPSQQSTPHAPGTQASSSELSSVDASPGEAAARARCTRYFESGQWSYRYDPGIRKNAWTLELTPTYCGRRIRQDETNAAYTELYKRYGSDWRWRLDNGGGMRRQLVCHLATARYKKTWNLEPFRPDVSHRVSVAAGCNPTPR
ncbi:MULTISPECIES: DUF2599 domain-containing protein [Pseudomonas]|uniref:DUF2599 domain-containing protein n=1 Tax=Pseudomonas qingdaonensis TaxID=2056231 RepID=A0ABX8DZ76_9PSED|nr:MULTISPECIES: DUF2599 domain-containing protein [Pseudomonas]MCO7504417.1 DUF2599 domain-containing protein [Pseudomonas sp. VE 267-6A]MCO7529627.1 DUF2599 domain-containing protein [Pseudomonas sp. 2]QVL21452.1 DUF2599 domain-containing protein [Pseudomonas qingdaonensis]